PARLKPTPERVRVTSVAAAGAFSSLVATQGAQGLDLEATAILNNCFATDALTSGELIKTVTPAKVR
ncbi:MAG: hypothetical protein AAB113_00110, partial [Candidatus Eisenbacteria bacterium]